MKVINDSIFKVQVCLIGQGEYHISSHHEIITTTLGSCISVCLFDKVSQIGGMNHYMLPQQSIDDCDDMIFGKAKYGLISMELLINNLLSAGCRRERFESKVFGGANMFGNIQTDNPVGEQNIAFAKRYLIAEGIPIVKDDVGGNHARKVYFDTRNGAVKLFRINNNQEKEMVLNTEKNYKSKIVSDAPKEKKSDKITFF